MAEGYRMCQDQPAQIDCRVESCVFYRGGGQCGNISPAIMLNPSGTCVCWSKTTLEDLDAERQAIKAEEKAMKVLMVNEYSAIRVTTDNPAWPHYRRYDARAWEQWCMGGEWCEIEGSGLEAAYQKFLREECIEASPEVERAVPQYLFYRRCGPDVWEGKNPGGSWCRVDDPAMLAELESGYHGATPEQDDGAEASSGTYVDVNLPDCVSWVEVAVRMKEQLCQMEAELMKSRAEANTFPWEADPDDEDAKIQEAMEYLAWVGRRLYPYWRWIQWESKLSRCLWERDRRSIKVRQWRGRGFSRPHPFEDAEEWGGMLAMENRGLLELWRSTPERKWQVGRQIVQQTIENTCVVILGHPYPEFAPTITEDSEEDADRDSLLEKLRGITQNPEVLRKAKEFHRKASKLSVEELLRRFTI